MQVTGHLPDWIAVREIETFVKLFVPKPENQVDVVYVIDEKAKVLVKEVRFVGNDHVSDDDNRSATVDRFLDELDAMAPSDAVFDDAAGSRLRSTSRESLRVLVSRFDELTANVDADGLTSLGDDLAAVAKLLKTEQVLGKPFADPTEDGEAKANLAEAVKRIEAAMFTDQDADYMCQRYHDAY